MWLEAPRLWRTALSIDHRVDNSFVRLLSIRGLRRPKGNTNIDDRRSKPGLFIQAQSYVYPERQAYFICRVASFALLVGSFAICLECTRGISIFSSKDSKYLNDPNTPLSVCIVQFRHARRMSRPNDEGYKWGQSETRVVSKMLYQTTGMSGLVLSGIGIKLCL